MSFSSKKTKEKLGRNLKFVHQHITLPEMPNRNSKLALTEEYWLEKIDPKHRSLDYLKKNHDKWKNSGKYKEVDFISWLDGQEEKKTVESGGIDYLSIVESKKLYTVNFKDGLICDSNNVPIDTTKLIGKCPGFAAYIITLDGELLITEHIKGKFQHSSFTGAEKIQCAGMIKIEKGKIVEINNISGHYRPQILAIAKAIQYIPDEVFSSSGIIRFHRPGENPVTLSKSQFLKNVLPMHAFIPRLEVIRNKDKIKLTNLIGESDKIIAASDRDKSTEMIGEIVNKLMAVLSKLDKIDKPSFLLKQLIDKGHEKLAELEKISSTTYIRHNKL